MNIVIFITIKYFTLWYSLLRPPQFLAARVGRTCCTPVRPMHFSGFAIYYCKFTLVTVWDITDLSTYLLIKKLENGLLYNVCLYFK